MKQPMSFVSILKMEFFACWSPFLHAKETWKTRRPKTKTLFDVPFRVLSWCRGQTPLPPGKGPGQRGARAVGTGGFGCG